MRRLAKMALLVLMGFVFVLAGCPEDKKPAKIQRTTTQPNNPKSTTQPAH